MTRYINCWKCGVLTNFDIFKVYSKSRVFSASETFIGLYLEDEMSFLID